MSSNIVTLYINSKDRSIISQPSTNFTYSLFPIGVFNINSFFVKSAAIPLSNYVTVYPSATGGDQTFEIYNFLNTYTVPVPAGNYTAQQLATTIQNAINALTAPTVFAVIYNTNTNKYEITTTLTSDLNFAVNNARYPYQSLGAVMGFRDAQHNPINELNVNAVLAPFEASLSGPLNYYIKSNALTVMTNSFFQGKKSSVIAGIPNNGAPFTALTYLNPAIIFEPLFNVKISQLDFQLVDEYGNEPVLADDWSVTIVFKCDT